VEFACNRARNKTTGLSPLKTVYGVDPFAPRDPVPREIEGKPSAEVEQREKEILELYNKVGAKVKKSNASYQVQTNKHRSTVAF